MLSGSSTECWLKVNGEIVLHGTRSVNGTLFKADIEPIVPEKGVEVHTVMENSSLLQLYHERCGHQDKRPIKEMFQKELGISVHLDNKPCESCIYGKAHRSPFGARKKATSPGELVSADVCGSFDFSFQKKRFLGVFKDSYTKFRYPR
ncbi:hypothetical protein AVEN_242655-1 [Araneus ventricosus]|uniref:GAG-pre-integrase domain-containing protein n=1 Tax=Araneus ventricosus TaxID=182803 RepID=A0A4Y2I838_ARAVE|nr:hypothetical protein AVEN_242655-1 [Araneus ventricosus]